MRKLPSVSEMEHITSREFGANMDAILESVTIEVRLPKEVYDSASKILAKQGLSMEDALILFLKETVRLGRIPFDYTGEDLEEVRRWERADTGSDADER